MLKTPTIKHILSEYPARLDSRFGPPERDVEDILAHALKKDRAYLYAHQEKRLSTPQFLRFKKMFNQRELGQPLQYIFGEVQFHDLPIKVNEFVLIPRPETELLVDKAREYIESHPIRNVVDIGTGSGAVIIALAKALALNKKDYNYIGTDKSVKALTLARINAKKNKVNIHFRQRDFIKKPNTFLPLTSWVLVSNPPYVPTSELSEPSIEFEPKLALDGGPDGLNAYRILIDQVASLQNKPKAIFFEIGHNQADAIAELANKKLAVKTFSVFQDFCGKDRVVAIELK